MKRKTFLLSLLISSFFAESSAQAVGVLVEAESFAQRGGWKLDTQFINEMGSPYLLAHGLGNPVEDARTEVGIPVSGEYRVWVRTKDWVARWQVKGQPGRFQIKINSIPLTETFGTKGKEWFWHDGGTIELAAGKHQLALHDLTGFDGRCDAIFFTNESRKVPPHALGLLTDWRRAQLGLPNQPVTKRFDLVVIGGGYSGMGAALSAARMGCKVALIQDRAVLGGNGSSEVRVWANGFIRRGRYPRIGEIVEEFADKATKSPGNAEEFGDDLKEQIVRAEKNIDLYLNHFADNVTMEKSKITSVEAFDTRTGARHRFEASLFADCTGHGTIGALAGADWDMTEKGRMGMSNMWAWGEADKPTVFPPATWALDLMMKDFPYPRDHHGQWFWESGFDRNPLDDAEGIRDWNLRAVFGAFNAMKNRDGADKHRNAHLTWVAFIGGPRESRRLMGDIILTQDDVVTKRDYSDGCVPSTWTIDLHYPKQQYAEKFAENPFIAIAVHDRRIDRAYGYPVPYRCFYSRNIDNLFMAGRNISVTHEALGTTRVMKTCGMMGEVVGKAASICIAKYCSPREIYTKHLDELKKLMQLPGKAQRPTVTDEIVVPDDIPPLAGPHGPLSGINPNTLEGIVVDDTKATKTGSWRPADGLKGFIGYGYLYANAADKASIDFEFNVPKPGRYEVRLSYGHHENRSTAVPVTVLFNSGSKRHNINMRQPPPLEGFISLGIYGFTPENPGRVQITTEGTQGNVHADAVQVITVK
jgi:hypothetical protein